MTTSTPTKPDLFANYKPLPRGHHAAIISNRLLPARDRRIAELADLLAWLNDDSNNEIGNYPGLNSNWDGKGWVA